MNHPPAAQNFREQQAGSLQAGDHLLLPDGERSAEIHSVEVENDDFGTPAIVLATLTGGGMLRIAAGSSVRIAGPQPASEQPVPGGSPLSIATGEQGRSEHLRGAQLPQTSPTPPPRFRWLRTPAAGRLCPRRLPPSSCLPCLPQHRR